MSVGGGGFRKGAVRCCGDYLVILWPALPSGSWGKLSKDLDAWVGLWKYDFRVN